MDPVTVWERWHEPEDEDPGYRAFDHDEEGHSDRDGPVPFRDPDGQEYRNQRDSWSRGTWRKSSRHLTSERRIVEAGE